MNRTRPVSSPPRRRLLQVGGLGLFGLNLVRRAEAARSEREPAIRACILLFHYGGPSHVDMWDMKPDAPSEVRGEYRPIETSAPGIRICEHMPMTARVMHHVALIRSLHHPMRNHNSAAVEALCGRTPLGGDLELLADTTASFPCYGSLLACVQRERGAVLPHVALPHPMRNVVKLPGQTAGFLGPRYEPYQVDSDPNEAAFTPGELDLPPGISTHRLANRERLLAIVDASLARQEAQLTRRAASAPFTQAFGILRSASVRESFDLSREPHAVRERYGRHKLGQSLLLARRLVEGGVPFVTVYDRFVNGQDVNWDSHATLFSRHREELIPPADRGFSALIEDLHQRGLLESTLVIQMGEFGRTPKINGSGGRDHWPDCFTAVMAGGGVRGGTVLGASDETGAYPAEDPVTPGDLAATLFARFGVDPATEVHDITQRPWRVADGRPLDRLFG